MQKTVEWKKPEYAEWAKVITELVAQFGTNDWHGLWGALLGIHHLSPLYHEEKWWICTRGTHPYWWEKHRDGRNGYTAKIKGEMLLIEVWGAGKKQPHMAMQLHLKYWPITPTYDIYNIALAHYELCYNLRLFMARRVFNEEVDPAQNQLEADKMREAIYKVLPESRPYKLKEKKGKNHVSRTVHTPE